MKHKKWLLILVLVAVITAAVAGGVGYAATTVWTGTATANVPECISVTLEDMSDGTYDAGEWSVALWPGMSQTITFNLVNSSGVPIDVLPYAQTSLCPSGGEAAVCCEWDSSSAYCVEPVSVTMYNFATLTITADTDAPVGDYVYTISFARQ